MPSRRIGFLAITAALALVLTACGDDGLQADAGSDFAITVGESPIFDGCSSSGEITNYAWLIVETPSKMDADRGKAIRETDTSCSFELDAAMIADEVGTWQIELVVTDADGKTSSDTVAVDVTQ